MLSFIKIGIFALLLYLPIFLVVIFWLAFVKEKHYSIFSFWLSNLSQRKAKSHKIFQIVFSCFALLLFFVLAELWFVFPRTILASLSLFFFALSEVSFIFILFLPMDKEPIKHYKATSVLFFSLLFFFIFSFRPISQSDFLPNILTFFNLLILSFIFLTAYSFYKLKAKYGLAALNDLKAERKKEKSLIIKNATLWEWLTFIALIAWFFLFSFSMIYV
ncbi:hypothetical protein FJ208_00035 [Candidatus Gribaldobacteria bacterium]|nr:hypothetical protein [Candidatus Gribaldobacteria bacterium]